MYSHIVAGEAELVDRQSEVFKLLGPIFSGYVHIMTRDGAGDCPVARKRQVFMVDGRFFTGGVPFTDADKPAGMSRFNGMASPAQLVQIHLHFAFCRGEGKPAAQLARRSDMADSAITRFGMRVGHFTLCCAYGRSQKEYGQCRYGGITDNRAHNLISRQYAFGL